MAADKFNWIDEISRLVYETHARVEWLEKVNQAQAEMLIELCKHFNLFEKDSVGREEQGQ